MSDLIDRQAAIEAVCITFCGGYEGCPVYAECDHLTRIRQVPLAKARRRKRGRWIEEVYANASHWTCNLCGDREMYWGQKYCGHCGAKMEDDDE